MGSRSRFHAPATHINEPCSPELTTVSQGSFAGQRTPSRVRSLSGPQDVACDCAVPPEATQREVIVVAGCPSAEARPLRARLMAHDAALLVGGRTARTAARVVTEGAGRIRRCGPAFRHSESSLTRLGERYVRHTGGVRGLYQRARRAGDALWHAVAAKPVQYVVTNPTWLCLNCDWMWLRIALASVAST